MGFILDVLSIGLAIDWTVGVLFLLCKLQIQLVAGAVETHTAHGAMFCLLQCKGCAKDVLAICETGTSKDLRHRWTAFTP